MVENGCPERYVGSRAETKAQPNSGTEWAWGKRTELQNAWGVLRRKRIVETNRRCPGWVEIAKWFKQVK